MTHAFMCPQCNAPLAPGRFARSVVCSYCGATVQLDEAGVSSAKFRGTFQVWNSPQTYQISSWISIGESHWTMENSIANGDISDVFSGLRARWPTELVIVKVLRDRQDVALLDNEWDYLQALHRSDASGADTFTMLLPQPVTRGDITEGQFAGRRANVFRWVSGFHHTFKDVLQSYPRGIPPQASIWIWRRILEILSFIHNSGMAHGAVLPSHLLVQVNEHGVRLVGYGCAGRIGSQLKILPLRSESFYPKSKRSQSVLTPQLDIVMSARCMIALLGGDPENGSLPSGVPARLAELVQRIARAEPSGSTMDNAWTIREELGGIAEKVFGPPRFIPIVMPS